MDILKRLFGKVTTQPEVTSVPSPLQEFAHLSNSYSGYERERALKELIKLQDPTTIPIFIERANDWVGVVRELAQNCLLVFLESHPHAFIENLPALFHLQKRRRYDHTELINRIVEQLIAQCQQNLIDAITSEDPHLAIIAFKICLKHKLTQHFDLIDAAISTRHITLARSVMILIDEVDDESFDVLSEKLLQHNFSPLKNKAIKRLDLTHPEMILKFAEALMTNKEESIRKIGRKCLSLDDVATTEFYQNILDAALSSQRERVIALIELTKLAPIKMATELEVHAKNSSPKIRKVALQQIVKLRGEQAKPILMSALLDENPSVTREAAHLCYKSDILLTQDELIFLATKKDREHILDSLLLLAKKNGKWKQLIINLQLLDKYKDEPFVAKRINLELRRCAHSSSGGSGFIPGSLVTELSVALEASKPVLDEWHYKTIRFVLETN